MGHSLKCSCLKSTPPIILKEWARWEWSSQYGSWNRAQTASANCHGRSQTASRPGATFVSLPALCPTKTWNWSNLKLWNMELGHWARLLQKSRNGVSALGTWREPLCYIKERDSPPRPWRGSCSKMFTGCPGLAGWPPRYPSRRYSSAKQNRPTCTAKPCIRSNASLAKLWRCRCLERNAFASKEARPSLGTTATVAR